MSHAPDPRIKARVPAGFGGRVHQARLARGWSIMELATAIGASTPTVSTWESGQIFWISTAALYALAAALEVEPAWLLTQPLEHA